MKALAVKFTRTPLWLRAFVTAPILLMLMAQSCSISIGGGGGVSCDSTREPAYLSSLRVSISGAGALPGSGDCTTVPKVRNTVQSRFSTRNIGVRNTPVTVKMDGGNYDGAPCFFAARWRLNNTLSTRMPCNFSSTGTKFGNARYANFRIAEWDVRVR